LNFTVDDTILRERLAHRAKTTGKFIPEMVLRQMFSNYECPTQAEGFDWVIEVDNT
jgi:hypothetical protein